MTNEEVVRIAQGLITDFKCESDTIVDFCNTIIKGLKQSTWIPVSNPREELPKDRILWVTVSIDNQLAVTTLYWDMTEWSEGFIDHVLAYMDYVEPKPYNAENEEINGGVL